jgi:hypothetical protein
MTYEPRFTAPSVENLTSDGLPGQVETNITGGDKPDYRSDPAAHESAVESVTDSPTEDFSFSGDTVTDRFTDPQADFSGPANPAAVGDNGGTGVVTIVAVIAAVLALLSALIGDD